MAYNNTIIENSVELFNVSNRKENCRYHYAYTN